MRPRAPPRVQAAAGARAQARRGRRNYAGRKNKDCIECGAALSGMQRLYCVACAKREKAARRTEYMRTYYATHKEQWYAYLQSRRANGKVRTCADRRAEKERMRVKLMGLQTIVREARSHE
jgi:hypothetical protein